MTIRSLARSLAAALRSVQLFQRLQGLCGGASVRISGEGCGQDAHGVGDRETDSIEITLGWHTRNRPRITRRANHTIG